MKFLKLMIVFIIALSASSNVLSASSDTFNVWGDRGCADWVNHHNNSNDMNQAYQENNWLRGFISGYSMGSDKDILANTQMTPQFNNFVIEWMNNYCRQNRGEGVTKGAILLKNELLQKQH